MYKTKNCDSLFGRLVGFEQIRRKVYWQQQLYRESVQYWLAACDNMWFVGYYIRVQAERGD